jgi:Winged helix-turn helix
MSDQEPIPDPVPGTAPPRAAEPSSGPVPGRLDPDGSAAPPHDPSPLPPPGCLTPPSEPDPDSEVTHAADDPGELPRLRSPRRGRRLVAQAATPTPPLTPQQRLLILDTWQRSGLAAGDFAPRVGLSKHTLDSWKQRFEAEGPAGLMDQPRGGPAGRTPEWVGQDERQNSTIQRRLPRIRRRHTGAVPDARKNRLTARNPLQEMAKRRPYYSS